MDDELIPELLKRWLPSIDGTAPEEADVGDPVIGEEIKIQVRWGVPRDVRPCIVDIIFTRAFIRLYPTKTDYQQEQCHERVLENLMSSFADWKSQCQEHGLLPPDQRFVIDTNAFDDDC